MSLAHTLIVEGGGRDMFVTLRHSLTFAQVWRHFTNGIAEEFRPKYLAFRGGVALVVF